MSNPPLNLSPYTVENACGFYAVALNGLEAGSLPVTSMYPERLTALLNDAYAKGVEDGRNDVLPRNVRDLGTVLFDDDHEPVPARNTRASIIPLLMATYGFTHSIAQRVMNAGICSPAAFEGVEVRDLTQDGIFTEAEAIDIMKRVNP